MTTWGSWVRSLAVGVTLLAACSNDGPAASTTTTGEPTTTESTTTTSSTPDRPASTTTTAFDPTSVEGQVEAAYLKSWDVYADAVYNLELDEAALAEVYADPLLGVLREELKGRLADGRAALVRVEHDYQIQMTGADTAAVIDTYRNHQVLIDPTTKEPVEEDPDKTIVDVFTLRRGGNSWMVFDQRRIR